jgi:hypothetical protein
MNRNGAGLDHGQVFLREQLGVVEHKIARLRNARDGCHDCMEAESLARMLHAAELEREVVQDLIACQDCEQALSLDAVLMQRLSRCKKQVANLSHGWRRGRPSPPGYWEAESRCGILTNLLRRYHAWHSGRPYYPTESARDAGLSAGQVAADLRKPLLDPTHGGQVRMHPWFIPSPNGTGDSPIDGIGNDAQNEQVYHEALEQAILDALDDIDFPEEHLEIIVQPKGFVIVKGYAHSEEQAEEAADTIMEVDGIEDLLIDIQPVAEARCPVCHPPEKPAPRVQPGDSP